MGEKKGLRRKGEVERRERKEREKGREKGRESEKKG
jgi:hypothetical protein